MINLNELIAIQLQHQNTVYFCRMMITNKVFG